MSRGISIFFGLIVAFLFSLWGMVVKPLNTFGSQDASVLAETGLLYPTRRVGAAQQGADVYRSLGCAACHTQQVQPNSLSPDIQRGWGTRRSVARDYLFDKPAMLGSVRVGPDLSDYGNRAVLAEGETREDLLNRELLRLYNPRLVSEKPLKPGYPFLFDVLALDSQVHRVGLVLPDGESPIPGKRVVPTDEAIALVEYFLSLKVENSLYEAPIPLE